MTVDAGKYDALLMASELLTIVFDNLTIWQKRRQRILTNLRLAERRLNTS